MGIKFNIGPSMPKVVWLDEIHSMSFSMYTQQTYHMHSVVEKWWNGIQGVIDQGIPWILFII